MAPTSDRIIVGVDFGTTFSGVAEAYNGGAVSANEIHVIKTWPGSNNITSDKVPSEIAYDKTASAGKVESVDWSLVMSDAFSSVARQNATLRKSVADKHDTTTIRWGFQISPDETRLRCVKLFLDSDQELPMFVSKSEIQELLNDHGKDATTVVADYLTQLHKHTLEALTRRYGGTLYEYHRDSMARKSGMGPGLSLISEPEAAAVYTLQAIQPNHLRIGDNFVVCDAGGGTVDLISYEIKQTNPLRVEESAEGSGACCGAVMLNAEFEGLIRQRMGHSTFAAFCCKQPKSWLTALRFFEEYVKRNFDPTNRADFNIPFPGALDDEDVGIEQGFLTLSHFEISRIFQPIIIKVLGLVEGQISKLRAKNKVVKGVVLGGGFGQSMCLYKALKSIYTGTFEGQQVDADFEILQPQNAWTAVVRGAVLRGVEGVGMVLSRRSRRHYGVEHRRRFDPAVHSKSSKVWDALEGVWMVRHQMDWYIGKGQIVYSSEPILVDFYRNFESGDSKTVAERVLVSDQDNAPSCIKKTGDLQPRVLCNMVINLAVVPAHHFKTHHAVNGRSHQRLSYQLGMQIESGGLKFDLRVDEVDYGSVVATFDAD